MSWKDGLSKGTPAYKLASSTSNTIRAVAGPGSGKSFALMRRIMRLLENGVKPEKILAITFTRTAAQDLKKEIESLGVKGAENVHSRTIHSHALKILMQSEVLVRTGRVPRMIIDHEILPAHRDLNDKDFGSVKEKKELLASYLAAWACLQNDDPGFAKNEIQEAYEKELINWLVEHEGILVGEVIPVVLEFLRNNPAHQEIGNYDYILVDEYQDLNKSEQEFIRLIRGKANLAIVGDDDQSIYGFKYAHPEGIRDIGNLFGKFEDTPFELCRRCPQKVTKMAAELIAKNPNRTLGQLKPYSKNAEGTVEIVQWKDLDKEIEGIGKIIIDELSKGVLSAGDILLLIPRRKIGYKLRDLLAQNGIPVKSYFRESVITSDKVREAYSLLNLLANPNDKISLRYLLGYGSNDYRFNQYRKLKDIASKNRLSLIDTLEEILNEKFSNRGIKNVVERYESISKGVTELSQNIKDDPEGGLENYFVTTPEEEEEFYEFNQIYRRAVNEIEYNNLNDDEDFSNFLRRVFSQIKETIALPDSPESIDHIRIMSLHSSKGLSAKLVIMCSIIDHLIPYIPTNISKAETNKHIEEQRRLFYVAMTRCKTDNDYEGRLIISSFVSIYGLEAIRLGIKCKPDKNLRVISSRFLRDMKKSSPLPISGEELI